MNEPRTYNALFLCTGNSARSQMAEALLNAMGKGRIRAYSAGSQPGPVVQPLAAALISDVGLPIEGLRPKSWDEFAGPDAPKMDFVITVCDNAAGESCPVWPGHPALAHWGVPDPAAVTGDEPTVRRAFADAANLLAQRIRLLASLPVDKLDRLSLQARLREIGRDTGVADAA